MLCRGCGSCSQTFSVLALNGVTCSQPGVCPGLPVQVKRITFSNPLFSQALPPYLIGVRLGVSCHPGTHWVILFSNVKTSVRRGRLYHLKSYLKKTHTLNYHGLK